MFCRRFRYTMHPTTPTPAAAITPNAIPAFFPELIPPDDLLSSSFTPVRLTPSASAASAGDGDGEGVLAGDGVGGESGLVGVGAGGELSGEGAGVGASSGGECAGEGDGVGESERGSGGESAARARLSENEAMRRITRTENLASAGFFAIG